jgi:hypothetical protein
MPSEAQTGRIAVEAPARTPEKESRRRRSRRATASNSQRRRLRLFYFSLASLWGFLIGTATLLFGFSLDGTRLDLSPVAIVAMTAAVVLAVIGGIVASRAYREASRRK